VLEGDDPRGGAFALFIRPHPGAFRQLICPPPRATAGHLLTLSVPGGGASAILSRPGGWAFAYPGAIPGHFTDVFSKVPWMSSSGKTRLLSNNDLSVRD